MGIDASLSRYKIKRLSATDRENYLDWRSNYYENVLNSDDIKWNEFENNLLYTSNRDINSIILNSIKETTKDTFVDDGGCLVNKDTINLAINLIIEYIKNLCSSENKLYKDECNNLLASLSSCLTENMELIDNEEYTFIYHVCY